MDMKRFFLFAIVIAALTLAGCGGNGGGMQTAMPDSTPTPDPTVTCPDGSTAATMDACPAAPMPEEMASLKDARDAAMAAYMMAMGYADSAKDYVAMGKAQKYADMAKGASDMAAEATTVAMAEEYRMKAEMYRDNAQDEAMTRGLGITKLANTIINQTDIDNAELEGRTGDDDFPKPKSNLKERVGTALDNSAAAMSTVAGDAPGNVSQGIGSDGSTPESFSATVDHTSTGPMYTVTRGADATVLRGENPTPLMTSGEKPSGGWPGAELVRTETPAGKTYVNIYTDIQPDTQQYTDPSDGTDVPLTLPTTPTGANAIVTGDVPGDGSSFTGTYNMNSLDNRPPVAGQFNCPTPGECSISVDEDGVITALEGYEFHAASTVTKPDADYMSWGVWLTVPTAAPAATGTTDDTAASVGAFASGNQPFSVRAALKGTATYNGDASGLYAAGGYVDSFDADVSLTANFGGTAGADSDTDSDTMNDMLLLGVVKGTVSNIRAGGMDVDGSLMLGRAEIITEAGDPATDGFRGDTSGSLAGRAMKGQWGGQFFGPSNATGTAAETQFPTTAAGTFGAYAEGHATDPVRILGAFGAWKAE